MGHAQVSMSSTSIVVKCLTDSKVTSSPHGQITIGTLILQVSSGTDSSPQKGLPEKPHTTLNILELLAYVELKC